VKDIDLKYQISLSRRLVLSIGIVLFITQTTTVIWLLHEMKEQLYRAWEHSDKLNFSLKKFDPLSWEVVGALFFPALVAFSLSLLACWVSIHRIISPLNKLTQQLYQRNVQQWQPFQSDNSSREIKEITEALNELMQKLQMAFLREKQFTADVSHELRTPIAGIRLNLELLGQDHPEEVEPLIQRLDSMQRTMEQLLTMARLEQNMVMHISQSVDLVSDVIQPITNELTELLTVRDLYLHLELPTLAMVSGDTVLLKLLVRNLIENSSRYADAHSSVELSVFMDGQAAVLEVRDKGPGVDEDKLSALTNAFQRFDQRGNGVGLGLNIVARIASLRQASLSLRNRDEPTGLVVHLEFPPARS
jgi:two-component system sensor histidine kinase BasS